MKCDVSLKLVDVESLKMQVETHLDLDSDKETNALVLMELLVQLRISQLNIMYDFLNGARERNSIEEMKGYTLKEFVSLVDKVSLDKFNKKNMERIENED